MDAVPVIFSALLIGALLGWLLTVLVTPEARAERAVGLTADGSCPNCGLHLTTVRLDVTDDTLDELAELGHPDAIAAARRAIEQEVG